MEEVFDRATVQAVLKLMRRGTISALKGVVSAGKESRVYWGTNSRGSDLAIKIYLTSSAEFRRGMIKYIVGDYRFDKNVPKSTRKLVTLWARKEFNNYVDLYRAGVSVPEPIDQHENVLVMEFIGEGGVRAPLLKEAVLTRDEYERMFNSIVEDLRKAYVRARLIHSDLSEYNIMVWNSKHYIIDVSQAVHVTHPNAMELLRRDVSNIVRFFEKEAGIEVPPQESILKYVTSMSSDVRDQFVEF
ncbi:MAG: serine protein kinase RIO [Zestosphaera sp.]